jgi:hypothetical protein
MAGALVLALQVDACRAGQHGPIVDGDPRDLGTCVHVDWLCGSCGLVLGEVSWTKAAWVLQQQTEAKSDGPQSRKARYPSVRRAPRD